VATLAGRVEVAYQHLRLADNGQPGRLRTARACAELTESLRRATDRVGVVRSLATAPLPATEAALAKSLTQAASVSQALQGFRWERLVPLMVAGEWTDERGRSAARIVAELRTAVAADEFAVRLTSALSVAEQSVFDWLAEGQAQQPDQPAGRAVLSEGGPPDELIGALRAFLSEHRENEVTVEWRVTG
jgi:hypothetical protein